MTPLDAISASRFPFALQHRARVAICQHVRGEGEIGPRWRKGSNGYRDDPWEYAWSGIASPCLDCGCTEGMNSWKHYLCCPGCGRDAPAGDYDWWQLGDVLRYVRDDADGLIETDPDSLIVHGFDVMTSDGLRDFLEACTERRLVRENEAERA